jgi:hypothetical protein
MPKLKSERHHWWPECVSEFWKDADGCAHRLDPNGELRRAPPKNFGVIGNGHHIKLSSNPAEHTFADESYEKVFHKADNDFPSVIEWLEGLKRENRPGTQLVDRFVKEQASDDQILSLVEGVVSLAVRAPMTHQSAVGLAEHFRGPLPERERNAIIGLNLRHAHQTMVKAIGTRGKFVAIYSPDREFIFGDGFFHNVRAPVNTTFGAKILVPLTPRISVLYVQPESCRPDPRLTTLVVTAEEANFLNETIQLYARNEIFFRNEQPVLTDAFRQRAHLRYESPRNPIDNLIDHVPGVTPATYRYTIFWKALGSGTRRLSRSPGARVILGEPLWPGGFSDIARVQSGPSNSTLGIRLARETGLSKAGYDGEPMAKGYGANNSTNAKRNES